MIICFIRLGQAFQTSAQLSKANEILERAYDALKSTDQTSLRNLLARVRQEHGIPSSVSIQTDPAILIPSVYRAEGSLVNSRMSISYPKCSFTPLLMLNAGIYRQGSA